MMRSVIWILVALLFERAFGVSYLLIPLVSAVLFFTPDDEKPGLMLAMGMVADLFMGRRFGITSLLFLITGLEVSAYASKFESDNFWSVFLVGMLMSAQATLLWGKDMQFSAHALHGVVAMGFWIFLTWWNRRGYGKDLYIKT